MRIIGILHRKNQNKLYLKIKINFINRDFPIWSENANNLVEIIPDLNPTDNDGIIKIY